MRKNKNNKFTYAFGAAAAAVVYMVAPLPEAGAAIFKGSTTIKWNENETLKLDVELEADQIPTESLTTYSLADLSKFTSIKATLNPGQEGEISLDLGQRRPSYFAMTVEDGNVTGFEWMSNDLIDWYGLNTTTTPIEAWLENSVLLRNYSSEELPHIEYQKLWSMAAGAEPNQPVPEPVPEPGFILGFITLASFMLGSRKKKEAKKT